MNRNVISRPKKPKSYGSGGYASGSIAKPCPTCYAPMERSAGSNNFWTCAKHGSPTRP